MRHSQLPAATAGRRELWSGVGLLLSVWICAAGALAPATLPVDALHPGQRGIGYSVLHGTQVDSFGVEILGVQHDAVYPGRDLILARLSGAGLEQTGIIQGMSGSPVYVDGRLIGAVAYGWSFATEPICGITPIGEMLRELERDLSAPTGVPQAPPAPASTAPPDRGLMPLVTPVWISGASGGAEAFLTDLLGSAHLMPVAGNDRGTAISSTTGPLRPGSSIGVQLVRGDLAITGIGTVTWIDGDRLLAFGHPMMGAGAVDMPLTRTTIHGVLPNQFASFVLGSAGETIGALRQDRLSAVVGVLGATPSMLPVTVSVTGATGRTTLSTEVLDHATFSGSLAQVVVFSALESVEKLLGLASLDVRLRARLSDGRQVRWNQVFSGLQAPLLAARAVGTPLSRLTWSGLEDVRLQDVAIDIEVRDDIRVAEITRARHRPQRPRAGERMTVQIELDPFHAPPQQIEVDLTVPASARGLPLRIRVGNGSAALDWDRQRRNEPAARDGDELLQRLARPRRDDELVVELIAVTTGMAIDGRPLPALPASVHRWLQQTPSVGRVDQVSSRVLQQQRLRVPFVLSGEQLLDLGRVER